VSLSHRCTTLFDRSEYIWQCVHNHLLLPRHLLDFATRSELRHKGTEALFNSDTRVDYGVVFGGVFDRMTKQVAHGVDPVDVVLVNVLQVRLVDELNDSYWLR